MTKYQIEIIRKEFEGFKPPENFAGGCVKSRLLDGFCVHVRADGTIGRIEEGCKNYRECRGYNFKYNP